MCSLRPWDKLHSEYLITNRHLSVRRDTLRLPGGFIFDDYYVVEVPDWVAIFALTEQGNVLLTRQYKHGIGEIVLELPGGGLDAGESPEEAAARELLEETGYEANHLDFVAEFITEPTAHTSRVFLFLARVANKAKCPHQDPREIIEVLEVPVDELPGLITSGAIKVQGHVAFIYRCLGLIN